jgi:hypothetical protein
MIGLSLCLEAGRANASPGIVLSGGTVDDGAGPSTFVGTLSVKGNSGPWTFSLIDDAGGRFALSGSNLVVGGAPIGASAAPIAVTVEASGATGKLRRTIPVVVNRPLPALPLATGAKVLALGHSFVRNTGYVTAFAGSPTPRIDRVTGQLLGTLGPLMAQGSRFNLDVWYQPDAPTAARDYLSKLGGSISGAGGEHMPQTLARMDSVLALKPDIIVLDDGTNDISSDPIDLAAAIERYEALLKVIRSAGIWCVCVLPVDRTDWPAGDRRHEISNGLADYIVSLKGRSGIKVVDDRSDLADALAAGIAIQEDGVHLNTVGQWIRSAKLIPILNDMVQPGDFRSRDFTTANTSPLGGLLGTAGVKSGVTGSVATGMTAIRGAGQSDAITASKEVIASGSAEKQVFTITPAGNANTSRINMLTLTWADMNFSSLGIGVGDWIEAGFDFELSMSNDWLGLVFALEAYDSSTLRQSVSAGLQVRLPETQNGPRLAAPLTGRVVLPPFRILGTDDIAAPATRFRTSSRPIRLSWNKNSTDTLVAKIGPIYIRKTSDPRTAWSA